MLEAAPCLVELPVSSLSNTQHTGMLPLSAAFIKPSMQPNAHSTSSSLGEAMYSSSLPRNVGAMRL